MIRVCHVVRQYHPSVGGLESFVANLARSLGELGCANDIVTLDRVFADPAWRGPRCEEIDAITVRRVPMLGHRRLFTPLLPRDLLVGYDVLHVHGIDGMFERVARHPRRAGQICVATSHGAFFHTPWMAGAKRVYFSSVTRLAAQRYDGLIAISSGDEALMRQLGPDVDLIPNGVSPLGDFTADGADILSLGRLSSNKHVDRLIAAMAEPALADARLHVVGPDWDVKQADLARQAASLGIADRIVFHGRLDPAALARVARGCGVFVSASSYEGFGMSMIEAMSVGLAPVVEPNASFQELVGAAGIGALVQYDDPARAAAAIRAELNALTGETRRAARAFAQRYSWPAHAERTLGYYQNHLARARTPQAA